ncbi:probable boron transporter 7 [Amaranthus tricolor]|uniref:probable boron transporter 7 n=1 Tax=Amaranthus tricolor TaxID=29722 RepID=UPI002584F995|nr:probable boron transporter 7 [Amaranthus tricolor]
MEKPTIPFQGIATDFKGRLRFYRHDWLGGATIKILAPTICIFFASALPVIAFGEQLSKDTDGSLSTVETLCSTAICGIIHSIIGGQPLLILGVAEPTIIMYSYLYNISRNSEQLGKDLFLAWTAWVCLWTAMFLFLLAIFNASNLISRFTRLAGELFGMLISVLFMQAAIKGVIDEFCAPHPEQNGEQSDDFQIFYINGLLAVVFSFGVLFTSVKSVTARSWQYGTGWFRSFIADYGVPVMIVLWTTVSYLIPSRLSSEVPRRLEVPSPWEPASQAHWTVFKDMSKVPVSYIIAASIPAVMIAGLYFFDHSVASQMAQQPEFNLKKPSAYHYDLFVLGFTTLICGLLGLPPCNGVLPQAPMHTKSLAVLRRQLMRQKMISKAKECIELNASNSEIYQKLHDTFMEMDPTPNKVVVSRELWGLKEAVMSHDGYVKQFDPAKNIDAHLPIRVSEQRWSNLLQSILVGLAVGAIPIIKQIPTSVLWGYFAFMSLDSLPGNQFWERLPLLLVTRSRRYKVLEGNHASFVESVPFKYIMIFTVCQLVYFLFCFGITWIPIVGILFPLPFFFLIPIREYLLPKLFPSDYLQELDAAEYEEVIGAPHVPIHSGDNRAISIKECLAEYQEMICSPRHDVQARKQDADPDNVFDDSERVIHDEEVFDVMTTRRGELKHRSISSRRFYQA